MSKRLGIISLVAIPHLALAEPEVQPKVISIEPPVKNAKGTLVQRTTLEIAPRGKAVKEIAIENPLGDVRVEGYDGEAIQIETRKQGPTEEAIDRLGVTLVPNPDGKVRLKTKADGGPEVAKVTRGQVRIDLIVRAPRNAYITAASSAGALEVLNMDAGGDLDTASGNIVVRNVAGELSTHSVTGATSLTQVFGSVDAQILSNNLDLDSIGGEKLFASVDKGKIQGRRVRSRNIELTTIDGAIVFEGEAALRGRLIISSMNGDIDVKLRRNGVLVVRGRGSKVNLGSLAKSAQNGWVEAQHGKLADGQSPATVELSSRKGTVDFSLAEW